nr:T9SS type A sorting domain-containing protein [Bacteroidota bacterium]
MNDLSGDGWQIIRHDFSRTAPDTYIKAAIANDYVMYNDVNAALILGHLAVPYSGNIAPDGHLEHAGAWPADIYYGCMDSAWTDTSVIDTIANYTSNHNIPGDGKWDQSLVPKVAQLQIGRIDFYYMPAFASTEIQLMKKYLVRNHNYKMDSIEMRHRGIICNQFNYSIEGFAANGWRNFAPLLSTDSIIVVGYYYLFSSLASESYQWAYGCGGGTFTSANGIGTTFDITTNPYNNIFSMLFGSYFGDWNVQNNFLRAPLCATPPALTNCWAGRPNWVFHHMALGENIGYSSRLTQNNLNGLYTMPYNYATGGVHVALMGDVSLRTDYIKPISQLTISPTVIGASLNWNPSPDAGVLGYHIYRADSAFGYFTKINDSIVLSTAFDDTNVTNGLKYYMVRPVKFVNTASGNYYNLGVGITDTVTVTTTNVNLIEMEASLSLRVFPNPAAKILNVVISTKNNYTANLYITNEKGQIQNTITKRLNAGTNNYAFNIASFSPGLYFVAVKTKVGISKTKWIKL